MTARNPWLRDMYQRAVDTGLEYGRADVDAARAHPPEPCGTCGRPRHFKPTVGAYVCAHCGAVKTRFGERTP